MVEYCGMWNIDSCFQSKIWNVSLCMKEIKQNNYHSWEFWGIGNITVGLHRGNWIRPRDPSQSRSEIEKMKEAFRLHWRSWFPSRNLLWSKFSHNMIRSGCSMHSWLSPYPALTSFSPFGCAVLCMQMCKVFSRNASFYLNNNTYRYNKSRRQ